MLLTVNALGLKPAVPYTVSGNKIDTRRVFFSGAQEVDTLLNTQVPTFQRLT